MKKLIYKVILKKENNRLNYFEVYENGDAFHQIDNVKIHLSYPTAKTAAETLDKILNDYLKSVYNGQLETIRHYLPEKFVNFSVINFRTPETNKWNVSAIKENSQNYLGECVVKLQAQKPIVNLTVDDIKHWQYTI